MPHATNLVALGIPTVSEFVLDIRDYRALVTSIVGVPVCFLRIYGARVTAFVPNILPHVVHFAKACFGTEAPLIHTVIIYILIPISYLLLKSVHKILRTPGVQPTGLLKPQGMIKKVSYDTVNSFKIGHRRIPRDRVISPR